ncbi:MAG: T9SS type A sorting domain-containing protein, partial [Cyclobacteriaceae bacterium]|nr:T9SS type A sorting domain-containing protein [Cyclobacteriaceae bacterium]
NNTGSITMAGGATINVIAGTMTGNAPVGTSYNVDYANTGALATGLELPTSITLLNNLSKSGGGILSLSNPITVNGIMTIGGGFNAGSNAIDLKGNLVTNVNPTFTSNTVTFSGTTALSGSATPTFGGMNITGSFSPSINYQVNGNFINNGTVSHGGSVTTTFGGTTTVSGSTTTFNNISITGTLTAPTGTMNVAGNFANSGTFNNSGGTVGFTGTTSITGTVNFGSILISGTLNSPASLNVARNFTNNGTFNRGTGTVVFNGTSTQSILGSAVTDFNNVTVTNTAGPPAVQVESDQNLRGVLTLASNSIFDADGSTNNRVFKLVSSSDSPTIDASIATLPSGAQVTGNVTVQRYMAIEGANSGRIYRYISSPVSSAPVSQIQTFIPVSGAFSGASSAAAQSMFSYNETDITGDFNTGYVNFPVAANTETFAAGVGYSIFVRGNAPPVSVAGSALYELRGPIFSGNQSLPVSFTSSGTVANDGWNLVGNPYPSTIDWDATGWTRTNVNNAIYMRDNGLATPVYASYVGGAGTNGGSRYIPIGQAFFVKSDGGTPALSVAESVKVAGTQSTFFREGALPDLLRITLRQGNVSDESVLRFTASATAGFDAQWDAYKLKNQTFNLSSLTGDGKQLAINAQPALACGASVKLDVSNASTGSYNLDFSGFDSFADASMKFALIDAYVSQTIDVKQNTSYAFQVTTDPASFGRDRFTMVVGESVPTITAQGSSRCGSGSVTLTAAGAANGNYRWYEQSSGGSAIAGATAGQFATPSLIKTKTYYVASVNSSGCEVARVPVVATVNTVDQVTITTVGQSLQSNYDAGNQWYLNGQIIPGATGKLYEPKESGVYKVEVASGICTTSAERQFAITSLSNETVMDDYISISPNPTKDIVSIQVKSPNEVGVQLISLAGSVLQESKLSGVGIKKGTLNLQEQAVGLYILLIQDGSKVYRKRIIKNQ